MSKVIYYPKSGSCQINGVLFTEKGIQFDEPVKELDNAVKMGILTLEKEDKQPKQPKPEKVKQDKPKEVKSEPVKEEVKSESVKDEVVKDSIKSKVANIFNKNK